MPATITVPVQPDKLHPMYGNGNNYFKLVGSNPNAPAYRYYADVYTYAPNSSTTTFRIRKRMPPRPENGTDAGVGIFNPNPVLVDYAHFNVDNNQAKYSYNTGMIVPYYCKFGFGYNPQAGYGSNTTTGAFRGGAIPTSDYPNVITPPGFVFQNGVTYYYLRLFEGPPNTFQVGDTINISKNVKAYNGYYEGQCQIRAVGFISNINIQNLIDVNILFSADYNTPGSPGSVSLYGQIASDYVEAGIIDDLERVNIVTDKHYAWPGTHQYFDAGTNWTNNWQIYAPIQDPATQHWLTKFDYVNQWKKIYRGQNETVNYLHIGTGTNTAYDKVRVRLYNSTNPGASPIATNYFAVTADYMLTGDYGYFTLQANLDKLTGSTSYLNSHPTAIAYDLAVGQFLAGVGEQFSIPVQYQLVCPDAKYKNTRIVWMNRYGGYDYFNFSKSRGSAISANRTEFNKSLGYYERSIGNRQTTQLTVDVTETFRASTDYITYSEYLALREIIFSSDVYVEYDGDPTKLVPINITDNNLTDLIPPTDKLLFVVLNYKYSHQFITQG